MAQPSYASVSRKAGDRQGACSATRGCPGQGSANKLSTKLQRALAQSPGVASDAQCRASNAKSAAAPTHLVPASEPAVPWLFLKDVCGPAQQVAATAQSIRHSRQDGGVAHQVPHSRQQQV